MSPQQVKLPGKTDVVPASELNERWCNLGQCEVLVVEAALITVIHRGNATMNAPDDGPEFLPFPPQARRDPCAPGGTWRRGRAASAPARRV